MEVFFCPLGNVGCAILGGIAVIWFIQGVRVKFRPYWERFQERQRRENIRSEIASQSIIEEEEVFLS